MKRLRPSFRKTWMMWVWEKTAARCRRNCQGACANGQDWLEPLCSSPSILLVDEPVSGLDRVTASEIDDLLLRVRKRDNTAMVIVTHDTREARRVGDRVGVLNNGNLIAVGGMDELAKNQSALVRALVSEAQ